MPLAVFLLAIMCAFLGGVSPLLQKKSMQYGTSPDDSNAFRTLGYLPVALACVMIEGFHFPPGWFFLIPLFVLNVTTNFVVGDTLFFSAVRHAGASLAMAVVCCYPIVSIMGAVLFLGEKLRYTGMIGAAAVVLGLLLVQLASRRNVPREEDARDFSNISLGILFALLAALFWGGTSPFSKWLLGKSAMPPGTFNFVRAIALLAVSWTIWLWQRGTGRKGSFAERGVRPIAIGYLVLGGVLALGVLNYAFAWCIKLAPVSRISPIIASSPIFTMIIATRFMKEKLRPLQWAGGLLVVGGAILVGI